MNSKEIMQNLGIPTNEESIKLEKIQADLDKVLQDKEHDKTRLDIEIKKISYEKIRLIFYGIAVTSGVAFIITKAITLLNTTTP